ncbi:MAG TPA: hypothetical protein VJN88_02315 [Ktedonobacterales bacterium]|nr:hypothetical protein [Ktedonobacterales bacterium]
MNRIMGILKATYNFFAGDAIILTAVIAAFVIGWLLVHAAKAPNALIAVVFIVLILAGITTTLGRELAGRKRA